METIVNPFTTAICLFSVCLINNFIYFSIIDFDSSSLSPTPISLPLHRTVSTCFLFHLFIGISLTVLVLLFSPNSLSLCNCYNLAGHALHFWFVVLCRVSLKASFNFNFFHLFLYFLESLLCFVVVNFRRSVN